MSQSARHRKRGYVVCIGGANMDIKCRIAGRTAMATSNPGAALLSPGGVARNIAENLARLGLDARLISVVGRDALGRQLLAASAAAGVGIRGVTRTGTATGTYAAVLDSRGELVIGVAAMAAMATLTPRRLAQHRALIAGAALIVADSNLPPATLDWLIALAAARGLRLAIETVSVPKGGRLKRLLAAKRPLFALFCNRAEAAALTGRTDLRAAARRLHALGVRHLGIGLGRRGMFVSDGESARIVAAMPARVVDVTGAGDAAVAGTLYGLLRGEALAAAAICGQAAAALALASDQAVSPALSERVVRRCVRRHRPSP